MKIGIKELYDLYHKSSVTHNKLINIRGCNGSGKSTIPISMMENDPFTFEVTWMIEGKERVLATVFPSFHYIALGHYHSKCGGMDSMKTTDEIKLAVDVLWNLDFDIIMEGIMASTVRQTYIDLFQSLNEKNTQRNQREIIVFNILPPLQVCLDRIQMRNGGKPIKEDMVASKWNTVEKNIQYFESAGFKCIRVSNEGISRDKTLEWFFECLNVQNSMETTCVETSSIEDLSCQKTQKIKISDDIPKIRKTKLQKMKELPKYEGQREDLYIPDKSEIKGYEWSHLYKNPDDTVVINWDNMRLFWYWMSERMNIWYKRTILKELEPWTDDKILQEYKFTNVIRDLDKGTIYYIRNILSKIDEPFTDFSKRVKEIIINTMIYRLFIKRETVDAIGFLYLDTWKSQWSQAKKNLRALRDTGTSMFHGAYWVYSMWPVSPSPDNHDKTENAINLIEKYWLPKLDEIYENVTTMNMEDLLEYLSSLSCVGRFNAYEFICDWALCHRFTKNKIVKWTDDSFVNIGPGNKRGLDFIFENSGNLTDIEKDVYLRATWKHYMKRYGYYDRFISQLPKFMNKDLNLRVIEHDCCEVSKYLSIYYGIGKVRGKFSNDSKDNLHELLL